MSAAEYGFPEPANAPASYLEVTDNCFKNIMSRWDTATCGGGLKWQIYPENAYGYNYKNSISNGAAFALAARLARFTGKSEYSDWAAKIYDWTKKVGLIGSNFEVFDGTDDKTNCATVSDKTEWTYNNAMFLHGSAFMYDVTKDNTWKDRTDGFLNRAGKFFDNPNSAQGVMFEVCEPSTKGCNIDQQSFKAYLARWMAKTAILVPSTKDKINNYLTKSAVGASKACSGGSDGKTCGSKWYAGSSDNISGLGQQLSALEVTQALAMIKRGTLPGTGSAPAPKPSSAASSSASSAAPKSSSAAAPSSSAAAPSSSAAAPSSSPPNPIPSSKAATSGFAFNPAPTSVVEPKPAPSSSKPAASSVVESKPAFSLGPAAPSSSSKAQESKPAATSAAATGAPAPSASSPAPALAPAFPVLGGMNSTSPDAACSCTGRKTVTVYVPPTTATPPPKSTTPCTTTTAYVRPSSSVIAPPVVPSVFPTPSHNATMHPTLPTGNVTRPSEFPGAASGTQVAGSSLFAAAALAVLSALF
jgi:mannan endo-1,6-alpha-mannosidase